MHLTAKFHHHTFNRSEVIVLTNKVTNKQTNKQTPLKTSTSLHYAMPVGKDTLGRQHYILYIRTNSEIILLMWSVEDRTIWWMIVHAILT